MNIRPADTYRVDCRNGLSEESMDVLIALYQPLIKGDALLVYLTLLSQSRVVHAQSTHAHLFAIMNSIDTDTFERARIKLEEYMLLRTFIKEGDSKNSYIYQLMSPMRAADFFSTKIYANRLLKTIGDKQFNLIQNSMLSRTLSNEGYKDITRKIVISAQDQYDNTVQYTEVKPNYVFSDTDDRISFDYEHFLSITTTLVFPAELRTEENMYLIGKLGTIYGISADRMLQLVHDSTNVNTMEFDTDKLKDRAVREKPQEVKTADPYQMSPVSFLMNLQNGASVTTNDKKILEHLSMDMKFSNEVINVLIEFVLKTSDNRLVPKYIDSVASEWARDGVVTEQQALLETKKVPQYQKNSRPSPKLKTPAYYTEIKEGKKNVQEKASAEQLAEIDALLKKRKEKK